MPKVSVKRYLRRLFSGRPTLQPFFEVAYNLSLVGMGYGSASSDSVSETLIVKFLAGFLKGDTIPVVFDVGASIGDYSSKIISVFGENVRLFCFEPSQIAYAKLIQRFGDHGNVKIYNLGLGDKSEKVILYSNSPGSDFGSIYPRRLSHLNMEMKYTEEIHLMSLDEFCSQNGINHIHLLKLDVEGNELNVLRGAKDMLGSSAIDLIQFEIGRAHVDARVYFKDFFYLLNATHQIYRASSNGLIPMNDYKENYEIFKTTNYLAVTRRH